jgi:cytochrome c oxidase subunit 4
MASPHARAAGDHSHGHDDGEVHAHVASWQFYVGIFGGLIVLTLLTVSAARFNIDGFFGNPRANSLNLAVAILIACMKAGLVAAFFMHLRHDKLFNTLAFVSAFIFLSIFLLMTRDDLGLRHEVDPDYGNPVNGATGERAPGGIVFTAPPGESAEGAGSAAPGASGAPAAPEKH